MMNQEGASVSVDVNITGTGYVPSEAQTSANTFNENRLSSTEFAVSATVVPERARS
jgi:hypothetical protein